MTRQQQWATDALKRVTAAAGRKDEGEYRTLCMRLPALLQQSGVVQTLTFLHSRGTGSADQVLDDVARAYGVTADNPGIALQQAARKAGLAEYLALSRDLAEVATWLRRFTQSELGTT